VESEGLARVIRRSYWVSAVAALILWIFWDAEHAFGLLGGGVWSATNLWAIKNLVEELCKSCRPWILALLAQIKMPVLYGVAALILLKVPLSVGAGIIGFHIPFVLIVGESVYHVRRDTRVVKAL
jgi:hypothetical protein